MDTLLAFLIETKLPAAALAAIGVAVFFLNKWAANRTEKTKIEEKSKVDIAELHIQAELDDKQLVADQALAFRKDLINQLINERAENNRLRRDNAECQAAAEVLRELIWKLRGKLRDAGIHSGE